MARYRDPDPGAVTALYHHGVPAETVATLSVDDVEVHGHRDVTVTHSALEEAVRITGRGATFVHALRAARVAAGARGADRLLVTHRADSVTHKYVSALARTPVTDFGTTSAPAIVPRHHLSAVDELIRWGITIDKLDKDSPHAA